MKKSNFVTLVMGTIGGTLFGIGMCMCLLVEWSAFVPGIVLGSIGAVVLLATLIVRRRMKGKPPVKLNGKTIGTILLGVAGALVLGVGMCMAMVWEGLLVPGMIVGIVGIVLLLCLVPVIKGIQPDQRQTNR